MKKTFISLLFLFIACNIPCKALAVPAGDGDKWSFYLAYREAEQVLSSGNVVYALFNGNLLAYDVEDSSVRTFDKLDGLSDKGISFIEWSDACKCLFILYENNNVDLLYEDGSVVNIPQIKNYSEYSVSARQVNVNGVWATVSTTEGVVLINIPRAEVKGYYRVGQSVNDAVVLDNTLYAVMQGAVMKGKVNDNLYDISQWSKVTEYAVNRFVAYNDGAYMLVPRNNGTPDDKVGICYLKPSADGSTEQITHVSPNQFAGGSVVKGRVQFYTGPFIMILDPEQPLQAGVIVTASEDCRGITYTTDGTYWLVTTDGVLRNVKIDTAEKSIADTGVSPGGFGPLRDYCFKLRYAGDRLLVAGGRMDYNSGRVYPATAMAYENGKWTFFETTGFTLNDNARFRNVFDIIQDPADPSHHYIACMAGLLEYRDFKFVQHFNHSNSSLEIAPGAKGSVDYVLTDGLAYDADGNLWMTNYEMRDVIKILKKNGTWASLGYDRYRDDPTPDKLLIDSRGYVWVGGRRTTSNYDSGVFGLNPKGTPDNTADDVVYFRSEAPNEDGTTCSIQYIQAIAEDRNGQIWLGCREGVFVMDNPEGWFSSSFSIYQPKVPRNDGTNYADYLLTGITVSAIAVDGGNRKWIGTMGSGIYLVNADGSEVINHFTADSSPLLSDNIYSLAINATTGELMIGTDKGLCSYRTDILPAAEKLSKSHIKVYPNPVRPEYTGNVVVTGLTDGAEVKIVSTGSQLIARGTSVGGTFTWNVRSDASGNRVAPGVYYLFISNADGSESVAAKMVVI